MATRSPNWHAHRSLPGSDRLTAQLLVLPDGGIDNVPDTKLCAHRAWRSMFDVSPSEPFPARIRHGRPCAAEVLRAVVGYRLLHCTSEGRAAIFYRRD